MHETKTYPLATAADVTEAMLALRDEKQAAVLQRFFKTEPGQYGAGDCFLGVRVPATRRVARAAAGLPLAAVHELIGSEWHEVRLCGFLVLAERMRRLLPRRTRPATDGAEARDALAAFYLRHARRANNWDLVDLSAGAILGEWLLQPSADGTMPDGTMPDRTLLDRLAASDNLWEQRIAIVATMPLVRRGQCADTLRVATLLLSHPHDLIHKAVGWLLREVGKRDTALLRSYLDVHAARMSRTTLRYAIERLPEPERREWMRR